MSTPKSQRSDPLDASSLRPPATPNRHHASSSFDFNAYAGSRKFNTRGSVETCQRVDRLTRVAVLAQSGTKSQIRVMGGPLDANVGWTNARLPIAGAKP